jgi:signal transduction histidine kinase
VRLAARLWVLGALVPSAALLAAVLVAGHYLDERLEGALDQALLSQAAVELVSLYDGPDDVPHLHIQDSPLGAEVKAFAPSGALYGPDGALVVRYPVDQPPDGSPATLLPAPGGNVPSLAFRSTPSGERLRVLTVSVPGPTGTLYTLQMTASMAQLDGSVAIFRHTGLAVVAALAVALLALQTLLARRLSLRVNRLSGHMAALREGDLEAAPPHDDGADEIGDLSRLVAAATDRLRAARAGQERLIAEAAHELRTPLTLVRTTIDLALRRHRAPEELEQALRVARDEVDRLATLASRLLDLAAARRGTWDRSPGDLALVAAEAAEAARADAEGRGVLVALEAAAPAHASFDRDGLRQALDNLLANAVRHSPPGGTVTVAVAHATGLEGAPLVRVTVRDQGPGIPAAQRERVFEPFARGTEASGAAGLGLAIVRDVLRGHGGRAYVAPDGPGATVVLELPAGVAPA